MAENNQDIRSFVGNLKKTGVASGEDSFRIDADWLQKSLDNFVLPEPAHGVLHAVASAVGAGAKSVQIELSSGKLKLVHNGRFPGGEELSRLFAFLLSPPNSKETYLRELAIACNAARFQKWSWSVQTPDTVGGAPHRMTLEISRPRFRTWWQDLVRVETALIQDRCRWSPIPISLNGTPLARGLDPQEVVAATVFGSPHLESMSDRIPTRELELERFNGVVFLGAEAGVLMVARGIAHEARTEPFDSGALVLVDADDLTFDITGGKIAGDEAYNSLMTLGATACDLAILQHLEQQGVEKERDQDYLARLLQRREKARLTAGLERLNRLQLPLCAGTKSVEELLRVLKTQGFLYWTSEPDLSDAAGPVLFFHNKPADALSFQLNLINYHVPLETLNASELLIKVPLENGQGEAGLAACSETEEEEPVLFSGETKDREAVSLDHLYRALVLAGPVEQIQEHLLTYLASERKRAPLYENWAAELVEFRRADGSVCSARELMEEAGPVRYQTFEGTLPPQAPDHSPHTIILKASWFPAFQRLEMVKEQVNASLSEEARKCFLRLGARRIEITNKHLLIFLAQYGASRSILEGINLPRPVLRTSRGQPFPFSPEMEEAVLTGEEECNLASHPIVCTLHLLVGILKTDQELAAELPLSVEELRGHHPALYEEMLETLRAQHPPTSNSCLGLAQVHLCYDEPKSALECCERAIDLNPHWVMPHIFKGISLALLGDLDRAEHAMGKAAEFAPDSAIVHLNLSELHILQNRWNKAEESLNRSNSKRGYAKVLRAKIALKNGDFQDAARFCLEALTESHQMIGWAFDTLAKAYEAQDDLDLARKAYSDFIDNSKFYFAEYDLKERLLQAVMWLESHKGSP